MISFLGKEAWEKNLKGFLITDCSVRDRNILYLCARQEIPYEKASLMFDHDIPTRIIAIFLDEPDSENWGRQDLSGMAMPILGVSRVPFSRPSGLLAARNMDGDVWPHGGGSGPMEHIHQGGNPFPTRLKCINGYTYAVCATRHIYKRIAVGKWELFADLRQGKPREGDAFSMGFKDMDAFSDTDMYAVGGHGDVWRYDGKAWKQMGFPSNVQLCTVTCAGDGNVYISGEGGSLWVGRESTWKRVYEGQSSILWNDVLWFDGKLWLASDYQFRIWDGKALKAVEHKGKSVHIRGHMDAYDGLLIVASPSDVMAYDGKEWRMIVTPYLS